MKGNVHKRVFICLLIAAVITVSGMYFDKMKVDSSFVDASCAAETVLSSASRVFQAKEDLCTRELLGQDGNQGIILQKACPNREGVFAKLVLLFSVPAVSPENSFRNVETEILSGYGKNSRIWQRIISYIHQQDGSKSR